MELSECQQQEVMPFEGKITSLTYDTEIDTKSVQLSSFSLRTDDKIIIFSATFKKHQEAKSVHRLLDSNSLQALDNYIQDFFCLSNSFLLSIQGNTLIDINVVREKKISQVLQNINQELIFTVAANIPIEICCNSKLAARHQDVFNSAAERWSEIVVGGYPNIGINTPNTEGLVIEVFTSNIDGPGWILGGAKPIDIRAGWKLPNSGWIILDSDDIEKMHNQGILVDVILHEIGHLLGLGTLWQVLGLTQGIGTSNPVFLGQKTMGEYARLKGYANPVPVPLENKGGFGTRDFHWRESIFRHELMTGLVDGKFNPISRLTIAALEDIGYQVNYDAADLYFIDGVGESEVLLPAKQNASGLYCSIA